MRIYGGITYKGRPYAGVGTSMRLGRGHQQGPCKYRAVRCGECSWCCSKRAARRASWKRTDGKTNPAWVAWLVLIGAMVVVTLPVVIFAAQLLAIIVR